MAQMVFLDSNVLAGPFETQDQALLAQVAASRKDAGQPRFPMEFVLPLIARGESIPFGHRFPVHVGRLVSQPDTYPNRWFVVKG